ncbi:pectin lyase fold/virulence factor [Chiua virens]|nr:pectin lyase fold/virulence factor [Chiua virens]
MPRLAALLPLVLAASPYVKVDGNTCTVVPIGGGQDDGPNIIHAFDACGSGGTIVLDRYYVVNTVLVITGLHDANIQLSGSNIPRTSRIGHPTLTIWSTRTPQRSGSFPVTIFTSTAEAPLMPTVKFGGTIATRSPFLPTPIVILNLTIQQTVGTAGGSSTTFARPVPLTVGNASDVLVEDLTQIGSPFWNNFVYQSTNVTYRRMNISSTSYSSNPATNSGILSSLTYLLPSLLILALSDGWDIYRSSYVTIEDSTIHNDDDCVSFKPNTTNTVVRNLYCNGSHGISVGSLGQYAGETDIVANIYVKNVSMNNAQNGARIKVFGGSPYPNSTAGGGTGYVQNITFEDFYVNNVDNPIYIDQCYDTAANVCAEYPSNLTISDIHYMNVTGMSSGAEGDIVVQLECSAECYGITAAGTNLTSPDGPAVYYCENIANETALDFPCTMPPAASS